MFCGQRPPTCAMSTDCHVRNGSFGRGVEHFRQGLRDCSSKKRGYGIPNLLHNLRAVSCEFKIIIEGLQPCSFSWS